MEADLSKLVRLNQYEDYEDEDDCEDMEEEETNEFQLAREEHQEEYEMIRRKLIPLTMRVSERAWVTKYNSTVCIPQWHSFLMIYWLVIFLQQHVGEQLGQPDGKGWFNWTEDELKQMAMSMIRETYTVSERDKSWVPFYNKHINIKL